MCKFSVFSEQIEPKLNVIIAKNTFSCSILSRFPPVTE
ncbi:hypothetical protein AGR1C_Lc80220 [Agrobacterium fabacearum TT111]|nr:hypothetical protein AGR1C_Lc80220 [Agrobacterium fabacearum TT111]